MLNSRRKDVRIFKTLFNLTGSKITIYDDTGDFADFEPDTLDIASIDFDHDVGVILHNKSHAFTLGIPYENVVVVSSVGKGRDGKDISNLVYAIDNRRIIYSPNHS